MTINWVDAWNSCAAHEAGARRYRYVVYAVYREMVALARQRAESGDPQWEAALAAALRHRRVCGIDKHLHARRRTGGAK